MCVFVSRPMKIVAFLQKNGDPPKRVVDFPWERDTFRNTVIEIVEDFDEKKYNNTGKPKNSSRILRVKPNFFIFLSFFIIFLIFRFFFSFFHFSFFHFFNFSIFFMFSFFHFFQFSHFSFISFFIFLLSSFSIFFFCFFFFFLSGAQNPIFLWPQLLQDFL